MLFRSPLEEQEECWRKNISAVTTYFQPDEETGFPSVTDGAKEIVGGIITDKKIKYTKNNKTMAFLTLEYPVGDQSSRIELEEMWRLIHPDDLTAFKLLWQSLWKADKEVFQCRARFAGSDYEWWEFRFSAMPAVDNAEGGKDVSGILININDMKKRQNGHIYKSIYL